MKTKMTRTIEMTLYDRRVEAAAEVLLRDYQSEYDGGEVSEFLDVARAALAAADAVCCAHPKCPGGSLCCCQSDAVVTEEMIAEELAGHPIGSGYYQASVSVDEAREMAQSVAALFRGGAK